jgi:hypothetical protein
MWEGTTMIRAMIGTIAVLAGFAVLERSVDASTGLAGTCTPTQAYATLHRGEAVAVRSEPTPEATVLGALAGKSGTRIDPARSVVTVTASQGGWARIALSTAADYRAADAGLAQPYGWVPADLLTVDARVDGPITVYSRPGMLGRALTTIEGDDMKFRVLGCRGEWLQVINARHGNVWIDKWCGKEDGCRS